MPNDIGRNPRQTQTEAQRIAARNGLNPYVLANGRKCFDLRLKRPKLTEKGNPNASRAAAASNTTVTIDALPEAAPDGSKQGIKVALGSGVTFGGYQWLVDRQFVLGDALLIEATVYIPGLTISGWTVRLTVSADTSLTGGSFTKRRHFTFLNTQLKPGFNRLRIKVADDGSTAPGSIFGGAQQTWTTVGGMTLADTVRAMQIDFGSAGGVAPFVASAGYYTEKPAMPFFMVGFDDFAQTSLLSRAAPALVARNIPFYVAGDGAAVAAGASRLASFKSMGADLIPQGWTHIDYSANPTMLARDYAAGWQALEELGLNSPYRFYAAPFSGFSGQNAVDAKANGVVLARSARREAIPLGTSGMDNFEYGFTNMGAQTVAGFANCLQRAIDYGEGGGSLLHNVLATNNPGGTGGTPAPSANDNYLDDYLAKLDLLAAARDAGDIIALNPTMLMDSIAYSRALLVG